MEHREGKKRTELQQPKGNKEHLYFDQDRPKKWYICF